MKTHHRPIKRRKFLKTGLVSGAFIAAFPVRKLFSFPTLLSDTCQKSHNILPREYHERLLDIALKYGGEFGEVSVEMESINR